MSRCSLTSPQQLQEGKHFHFVSGSPSPKWLSVSATHQNCLEIFKQYGYLGPTPNGSDIIDLGIGMRGFKILPGDSNV